MYTTANQGNLTLMFSKKATKIDEIYNINLTLCSKCQIDSEDFVNFCGLLKKHELYLQGDRHLPTNSCNGNRSIHNIVRKIYFNHRALAIRWFKGQL